MLRYRKSCKTRMYNFSHLPAVWQNLAGWTNLWKGIFIIHYQSPQSVRNQVKFTWYENFSYPFMHQLVVSCSKASRTQISMLLNWLHQILQVAQYVQKNVSKERQLTLTLMEWYIMKTAEYVSVSLEWEEENNRWEVIYVTSVSLLLFSIFESYIRFTVVVWGKHGLFYVW